MKLSSRIGLLLVFLFGFAAATHAQVQYPDKPPNEHFYVDEAKLLNPDDAKAIDEIAGKLFKEEKIPIIVVTISSLVTYKASNLTIDKYAQDLFDHWGIGEQNRNYGILVLVSVGDRKARVELGNAWGGNHDKDAKYVVDDLMVPDFKQGDFSGGIHKGVDALDKMARGLGLPKPTTPWWVPVLFIGGIILIVGVIISLFKSGRSGWGWALIIALGVIIFFALRTAANSSGSGGAFGGGSSGGGGATGSW